MLTLTNRFIAIGTLSECHVDIYPSRIKVTFALDIGQDAITMTHHVTKKFKPEEYERTMRMIENLHPSNYGYVCTNGVDRYYAMSKGNTKMLATGNMYPSATDSRIWFYAESIEMSDKSDQFSIELSAIPIDKDYMFNVVADSPRLFHIPNSYQPRKNIENMVLRYNTGYGVHDRIVEKCENMPIFSCKNVKESANPISDKDIDSWLLEWRIVNEMS